MNASGQLPSRTFYLRGKTFRCALHRTLVEPGAGLDVLFLPGIEPRFFGCPDRSLVTILIELYNLFIFIIYTKIIWIQQVNRMSRNRLPRVMKYYSPTGRRNHGRPLKRLLDTWDWNGSTSGPTAWKIYEDDDGDDDDDEYTQAFCMHLVWCVPCPIVESGNSIGL